MNSPTRAVLGVLVLVVGLAGCGQYAPPVASARQECERRGGVWRSAAETCERASGGGGY